MMMAFMITLEDPTGDETHLFKPVDLPAIPRIGEWVDTGSPTLAQQQVVSVAWHRKTGGVSLGRRAADATAAAELQDAGWRTLDRG
jgi:hypothetical protein